MCVCVSQELVEVFVFGDEYIHVCFLLGGRVLKDCSTNRDPFVFVCMMESQLFVSVLVLLGEFVSISS